jgi:hypothetical protein
MGANGRVLMMGAPGVSVMVRCGANAVTLTFAWLGRSRRVVVVLRGGRFWKTNPPVCGVTSAEGSDAVTVVLPFAVAVKNLVPEVVKTHVAAVDPVTVADRARVLTMLAATTVLPWTTPISPRMRTSDAVTVVDPLTVAARALVL